ncbi:O-antigen ligase family protein [Novosphingobium cyanobacteriorum]|uniref:O-antigen ligase family protein n=1 Tax=Novosphingobium cyanobacteriorum TaxID=3024215 RepID=A0ABT6CMI1_9SPHN|nr:O-antigen ligase family protein [Novosphingobium cyanobacteriorum]MDF8335011.1 O-antigen ligase family protein [Novosphingobium cyanobacteriorum]
MIFAATTIFRIRDYTDKSIDFQVMFKMMCVGLSLVVPLVALVSRRMSLADPILGAWLLTLLSLVMSATQADNPVLSLMNSVPMLGCFLFCVWMTQRLGEDVVVNLLILLVGGIAVISLVVYFAYPELGRMHAWLGSEFGENNRIQGIAGTPNGLGSMTSMALILTILYFRRLKGRMRSLVLLAAIPIAACLVMSNSRMSMASLLVCLTIYIMRRGNRAANIGMVALVVAFVGALLLAAPDLILSSLARSGQASEITSGTGRSEIWTVVIEHIAARPVAGYGYAMSTTILPQDPRLFSVAAHCHNMYLEVFFSGGIITFALLLVALAATLYAGLRASCFEPMVVMLFYLLRGITEPAPFDNLPSFAGYTFYLAIAIIVLRSRQFRAKELQDQAMVARSLLDRCRGNLTAGAPA